MIVCGLRRCALAVGLVRPVDLVIFVTEKGFLPAIATLRNMVSKTRTDHLRQDNSYGVPRLRVRDSFGGLFSSPGGATDNR